MKAIDRIGRVSRPVSKCPPTLVTDGIDNRHADDGFKLLQRADNNGAMSPGARQGYVQVISHRDGRIARTPVLRDPLSEAILLPCKFAFFILFVRKLGCAWHLSSVLEIWISYRSESRG